MEVDGVVVAGELCGAALTGFERMAVKVQVREM